MHKLTEALKLLIAAVGALALIASAYASFVTAVGGRVTPWLTPTETQALITVNMAKLQAVNDRRECSDWRGRLTRAREALARNPNDMTAMDLQAVSLTTIPTIPGCQ